MRKLEFTAECEEMGRTHCYDSRLDRRGGEERTLLQPLRVYNLGGSVFSEIFRTLNRTHAEPGVRFSEVRFRFRSGSNSNEPVPLSVDIIEFSRIIEGYLFQLCFADCPGNWIKSPHDANGASVNWILGMTSASCSHLFAPVRFRFGIGSEPNSGNTNVATLHQMDKLCSSLRWLHLPPIPAEAHRFCVCTELSLRAVQGLQWVAGSAEAEANAIFVGAPPRRVHFPAHDDHPRRPLPGEQDCRPHELRPRLQTLQVALPFLRVAVLKLVGEGAFCHLWFS
ncbi:hypothetical protein C8R44DRAFT_946663 [Mycena epipterygia]|nr:hypothetical protein C8R44DRAFT_946663 [Mycena epipterygia]